MAQATAELEAGDTRAALRLAEAAYDQIGAGGGREGAALTLLGGIHVEMGDMDEARSCFMNAVKAAPDDELPEGPLPEDSGGGAEKFLWLAQLSEEGGRESVVWFERGATVLRAQIGALTEALEKARQRTHPAASATTEESESAAVREAQAAVDEKKHKLAETLCAVAEVYMTDLSWEEDAEARCEALVTEAGLLAPDHAETWQTLANVRVSQARTAEARTALERSLALWADLPPEDPAVPPFPTRVGLARLLMEVEMEEVAVEVVERLVDEDDESVEAWYLGGYALYTIGQKQREEKGTGKDGEADGWKRAWKAGRRWLAQCLLLFQAQEDEDERLGEHAKELFESIREEIGDAVEGEEDEDDGWDDTDDDEGDDEDEEMQ